MKTQHCDSCGLCIENSSHHSFIFEKCIGKYNFFIFFSFVLLAIMYVTRTALLFLIIIYSKICSNFKQLCLQHQLKYNQIIKILIDIANAVNSFAALHSELRI